ncbi:MAG: T9SS type A sorting domain-containing protein [Reichenbachiella sp.]
MRYLLLMGFMVYYGMSFGQKIEAESGTLVGVQLSTEKNGYSGDGYVTGFDQSGDRVTMTFQVSASGLYELKIGYAASSNKTNNISVNGELVGEHVFLASGSFSETRFGLIFLSQGSNEITISHNWGWFDVDYIRVEPGQPHDIYNIDENLINPNASLEAVSLYQYLKDLYGKRTLSGQQSNSGGDLDLDALEEMTGKIPAIKGFDLIDYSPSRVFYGTNSTETQDLIDWVESGGIATCAWHWNAPEDWLPNEPGNEWWSGFYTRATTFDPRIAMNDNTSDQYNFIIRDIDAIAAELKIIQAANVPVLWRPLHEAAGEWFWWGAYGPEVCKWLWNLMYNRLTNHHELNNLIWVWTEQYQIAPLEWYPGDEKVDIIGMDIYLDFMETTPSFARFDGTVGLHTGKKIITMSETATIPSAHGMILQKAKWSWFCSWTSQHYSSLTERNTEDFISEVYNHEYIITFDEIPDLNNYESQFYEEIIIEEDDLPLNISEQFEGNISIYPNPTTGDFKLSIWKKENIDSITVSNNLGQKIFEIDSQDILDEINIDMSNQKSGVYIVNILTQRGHATYKLIKL